MDVARPQCNRVVRTQILSLSVGLAGLLLLTATAAAKQPDEGRLQTGIPQSSSLYVKLHDGVEIAVSLYVPKDLKANDRIPVLMRTTRYWREPQKTWMLKMLLALRLVRSSLVTDSQVKYFNERRLAVLLVDARGSVHRS
jgi:predicted acyl esterase